MYPYNHDHVCHVSTSSPLSCIIISMYHHYIHNHYHHGLPSSSSPSASIIFTITILTYHHCLPHNNHHHLMYRPHLHCQQVSLSSSFPSSCITVISNSQWQTCIHQCSLYCILFNRNLGSVYMLNILIR